MMAGAMKENQMAKERRGGGVVCKKETRASFSEELTLMLAGWQEGGYIMKGLNVRPRGLRCSGVLGSHRRMTSS